MHPELFTIGNFTLHSYGLFIALAFIAGIFIALKYGKKDGLSAEKVLDAILWVMLSAILGARVFYVFEFWREFQSPVDAFKIWEGGLVFYGGLIFAIIALAVFCRINKLSLVKVLDIAAICTAIGYSIGRIGCFLNGCCYGTVCNQPWAVKFPHLHNLRHPTQLYASLSGLLIFLILITLYKYKKFNGQLFSLALILYSIYRFVNEFFRINPRYLFGLSEAQLISIGIFSAGIIIYGIFYKRSKSE